MSAHIPFGTIVMFSKGRAGILAYTIGDVIERPLVKSIKAVDVAKKRKRAARNESGDEEESGEALPLPESPIFVRPYTVLGHGSVMVKDYSELTVIETAADIPYTVSVAVVDNVSKALLQTVETRAKMASLLTNVICYGTIEQLRSKLSKFGLDDKESISHVIATLESVQNGKIMQKKRVELNQIERRLNTWRNLPSPTWHQTVTNGTRTNVLQSILDILCGNSVFIDESYYRIMIGRVAAYIETLMYHLSPSKDIYEDLTTLDARMRWYVSHIQDRLKTWLESGFSTHKYLINMKNDKTKTWTNLEDSAPDFKYINQRVLMFSDVFVVRDCKVCPDKRQIWLLTDSAGRVMYAFKHQVYAGTNAYAAASLMRLLHTGTGTGTGTAQPLESEQRFSDSVCQRLQDMDVSAGALSIIYGSTCNSEIKARLAKCIILASTTKGFSKEALRIVFPDKQVLYGVHKIMQKTVVNQVVSFISQSQLSDISKKLYEEYLAEM